jgi:hypothetical protein
MPKSNKTSPQKDGEGRYSTPIPKAFGDSLNLEEKKLEWKQISGSAFRVEIVED